MICKILFYTFFLLSITKSYSQSFPSEKQKFVKYVDQLFSENESEKVRTFVNEQLKENILKNGTIDNVTFDQIVSTCNSLEQNKLKSYPDIFNYLYTINFLYNSKYTSDKIDNWHEIIDQLIETKNKFTDDYLKFTLQFFLYNKIADASNSKWFYKNGDYTFSLNNTPYISLKEGNLKCLLTDKSSGINAQDSIIIDKTSGILDIVSKTWEGSGGALNWTKTGIDSKKMFASFQSNYKLNFKSSELKLDSVLLTAPFFKNPIYGTIEDRTNTYLREIDRIYPRFYSYNKRVKVENILEGIDYDGGFLIEGNKLIGSGDKENPSKVIVKKDNLPIIIVSSELFELSINSIRSSQSAVKIKLDNDSISHGSINFSYDNLSKEVEISRPVIGRGNAPFENSFHMLDMFNQRILYKIGSNELRLTYDYGASTDLRNAIFESKNYFNEKLFDSFKGQDAVNPLINAVKYAREKNIQSMPEGEFATALNKYLSQCKSLMLEMASHGFINYDLDGKMVSMNDKIFRYVDYKLGQGDFDNLSFKSDLKAEVKELSKEELVQIKSDSNLKKQYDEFTANENRRKSLIQYGILNIKTKELIIDGVDFVSISTSQPTFIAPSNLIITVKKNRDLTFNGSIFSGKLEIENELGSYKYASNSFEIKNATKAVFTVIPFTEKDKALKSIEMISHLTNVNGSLLVDDVGNRSGRKKEFVDYPKLSIDKPCKIFYNEILNGAYDSTRFFVSLDPFEIDSLDNFKESSLTLNGELTSAGIFPKMKEKIKIMDDYSFGFSSKAPEEGYKFYNGNTSYKNKIVLSANGLQGAGTINFLNSISESKALTFLPDSTIGIANFVNKPSEDKVEFPDVYNERSFICYIPKSKILKASSTNEKPNEII